MKIETQTTSVLACFLYLCCILATLCYMSYCPLTVTLCINISACHFLCQLNPSSYFSFSGLFFLIFTIPSLLSQLIVILES